MITYTLAIPTTNKIPTKKFKKLVLLLFYSFMEKHNMKNAFLIECIKNHHSPSELMNHASIDNPRLMAFNLINKSLIWDQTDEGYEFWHSMQREWILFLINNFCNLRLLDNTVKYTDDIKLCLVNLILKKIAFYDEINPSTFKLIKKKIGSL